MKLITGVFFMCLIVCDMAQLTPKQHARIKEISDKCEQELDITLDESFLSSGRDEGILFNDDIKIKMFIACFLTKLDAVSPDGLILANKLLEFLAEGNVAAELEDTVVKCAAAEGGSLDDRAYNFLKCYLDERMTDLV